MFEMLKAIRQATQKALAPVGKGAGKVWDEFEPAFAQGAQELGKAIGHGHDAYIPYPYAGREAKAEEPAKQQEVERERE